MRTKPHCTKSSKSLFLFLQ